MTRSKDIGTRAETVVAERFRQGGFPRARRMALRGALDVGDIDIGDDRVVVEVKAGNAAQNASDKQVHLWLKETEKERQNAGAELGILVMKRKGIGHGNAGEWWAVLDGYEFADLVYNHDAPFLPHAPAIPVRIHLDSLIALLSNAGYGTESK